MYCLLIINPSFWELNSEQHCANVSRHISCWDFYSLHSTFRKTSVWLPHAYFYITATPNTQLHSSVVYDNEPCSWSGTHRELISASWGQSEITWESSDTLKNSGELSTKCLSQTTWQKPKKKTSAHRQSGKDIEIIQCFFLPNKKTHIIFKSTACPTFSALEINFFHL